MSQGYARIAFTPAVQALQRRHGSSTQYTLPDAAAAEPDEGLGARERAFIAARDTLVQATVSQTGWPYVQHRGGPPGFIQVLDDRTIAYPDFRGNQQYLSVGNLSQDDRISILLIDPAAQRRLKLFGRARLLDAQADPALFARLRLVHPAATVERVFVVQVAGHDWNCPQHIVARFTEQEVAAATAPLRARAERAEQRVAELQRAAPAAAGPRTLGSGALPLVVAGVRQLTPRVRAFELRHADGLPLPAFDAGAHLVLPVAMDQGAAATRHYSIASNPRDRSRYEVAVLHKPGGGAAFAHAQWSLGTVLRADPPQNHFPLAGGGGPCLLVAGGIGITPLKAMALQLVHAGRACELHHAVRSVREAVYADELAALLGARHVLHPSDVGRRLDIDRLLQRADAAGLQVYVCGPSSLVAAVRTRALAAGVAPAHIHSERFAPPDGQAGDTAFALRLHRSGRVVHVLPGQSMLQALEQAGVPAAASCRVGICRTCTVPVMHGTPDHRDEVLSAEEHASGRLVCLCVSRAHTPELTLDL